MDVNSKIVVALERLSEAFRVLLWNEGKQNALSPIQVQILIFLLFHSREKCSVSYLAREFNMSKPTISDSIRSLLEKGLVRKYSNASDTRSYALGLTRAGESMASQSANFASAFEGPLELLSGEQKKAMLAGLFKIIQELNQAGIITVQRMCFSCRNYRFLKGSHYCSLLETRLAENELRLDCREHELKV